MNSLLGRWPAVLAISLLVLTLLVSPRLGRTQDDAVGIYPREGVTAYPAHTPAGNPRVGAQLLTYEEVEKRLYTPFGKEYWDRYYVVEVGIYPDSRQALKVKRGDFRLRAGGKSIKAAHPTAVARFFHQTAPPRPGIYTEREGERTIGWNTQQGTFTRERDRATIGNGRPVDDIDLHRMDERFRRTSFSEDPTHEPVAGYLYFPVKSDDRPTDVQLVYKRASGSTTLDLAHGRQGSP